MKANDSTIARLRLEIASAYARRGLTKAEIGRATRVDPGQVSRICRGQFKTISNNVVQICKLLGLKVESVALPPEEASPSWMRLKASMRQIWDQAPEGAERIARLLEEIAALKADVGKRRSRQGE